MVESASATDLYEATTFVTGQGEEHRESGFAAALRDVLVKVTGDPRLLGETRIEPLAADAASLVTAFSYRDRMAGIPVHDEQGTRERPYDLTVIFDPGKIDEAVRSLGRRPWPEPRPTIAALVSVRNGDIAYSLTRDGARGRDLRDALAAEAERLCVDVVLHAEAAGGAAGIENPVALSGTLTWSDAELGWLAEWRLHTDRVDVTWKVDGISFDAAFRSGLGGTAQVLSGNGRPH